MKTYLVLMALLLLAACSTLSTESPATAPNVEVEKDSSNTHQFIVRIIDEQPDVDLISVPVGDLVVLEIVNQDNRTMLFSIENYEDAQIAAGKSTTLIFEAHTKGSFNYGVRDSKEKGILVVE